MYRREQLNWLRFVPVLVLLGLFISLNAQAHRQNESYTTLDYNYRTGNLEISHRFYLHDVDHALKQVLGKSGSVATDVELQRGFSEYLTSKFVLQDASGETLNLSTVGFESDGNFLWTYQERAIPPSSKLRIKHTALQEFFPEQVNHINLEKDSIVRSVRASNAKSWYEFEVPKSADVFFDNLQSLCGAVFKGEMTYPEKGMEDFANKLLVAKIVDCSDQEIRVSFWVGDNRSRTWIFTKNDEGVLFKHEHRHDDSTLLEEQTNYGGQSTLDGTGLSQLFPADEFTAQLIPAAATNVWKVSFNSDKSILTYHLTRHDKPRFTAVLYRDDFTE